MQFDLLQLQSETEVTWTDVVRCDQMAAEIPEVQAVADATVAAVASLEGHLVRLEGTIRTEVTYVCSRCLKTFSAPLQTALQERFSQQAVDDEDVHRVTGRFVDVDPYVEQAIHLSIDPRPLCRADCKGLCPQCGVDWNESTCSCDNARMNPQFAALKDLHFDDDSE